MSPDHSLTPYNTNISPLWLDVSPRYQRFSSYYYYYYVFSHSNTPFRDFLTRSSSETLISVVYNYPPTIIQTESTCDNSNESKECLNSETNPTFSSPESEVIIYLSLITPVDEPDEYEWMKWPILGFGVAAFLLYKIFNPGTKFTKKTPTTSAYYKPGGVYGKMPSKQQSGFHGSGNYEEERTAELRRELDRVNGM